MKANFFIVGGPRCGTSALAKYLSEHPDCGFSFPKEPCYFCTDLKTAYTGVITTVEQYHNEFFAHLKDRQFSAIGEGTPFYLVSEVAIQNILSYNPDARFIAMLRNPTEMAYSIHRSMLQDGNDREDLHSLADAWAAQERRANGEGIPPKQFKPILLQYRRIASQGTQLKRLLDLAGPDKVHIVFFEDLNKSFQEEYRKVLEFLGLPPASLETVERVLPTTTWKSGLAGEAYRCVSKCAQYLPYKPQFGILRKIKRILSTTNKEELDPELKRTMLESFIPEIEILEGLTGRNLSHWKS